MSIILNKHPAKYKVNTTQDKGVTKLQKVCHEYAIGTLLAYARDSPNPFPILQGPTHWLLRISPLNNFIENAHCTATIVQFTSTS